MKKSNLTPSKSPSMPPNVIGDYVYLAPDKAVAAAYASGVFFSTDFLEPQTQALVFPSCPERDEFVLRWKGPLTILSWGDVSPTCWFLEVSGGFTTEVEEWLADADRHGSRVPRTLVNFVSEEHKLKFEREIGASTL